VKYRLSCGEGAELQQGAMSAALAVILAISLFVGGVYMVRRGIGQLSDEIVGSLRRDTARRLLTLDVPSREPPADAIATVQLQLAPQLVALGYKPESQSVDSLVVVRSVAHRSAYAVPLAIAAIALIFGINANRPALGGVIAAAMLWTAILLSLVVRAKERVTFTARPASEGSRIVVSGSATTELRDYLVNVLPLTLEART
jgi:hypothetical protein